MKNKKMYSYNFFHFNRYLYHDKMIISKDVAVIRNDDGELIDNPAIASFISSPAVFAKDCKKVGVDLEKINKTMYNRIDKILNICYKERAEV